MKQRFFVKTDDREWYVGSSIKQALDNIAPHVDEALRELQSCKTCKSGDVVSIEIWRHDMTDEQIAELPED